MKFKNYRFNLKTCRTSFSESFGKKVPAILLSSLLMSNVCASISAQTISIKADKITLAEALESIRLKTHLDLVGDVRLLDNANLVTLNLVNKDITTVIKELSKNQPVDFTLKNNTIIVKRKDIPINLQKNGSKVANELNQSQQLQSYTLVGKVTDENGKPIEGVNVSIFDTKKGGTTTTSQGTYSLQVNKDSKVSFSMMGYQTMTVTVNSKLEVNVSLKQLESKIEETIVTAYSKYNKDTYTGAVNTITKADIQKMSTPNILSIIQALDPSFTITQNNSAGSNPNVVPDATIRGKGSITGTTSNPLVILDGFPISMRELYDIDIERIQSIHILKDATATALYGSNGANGVIQVETVLPKDGKLSVSYSVMPTVNFVDLSSYNLMNAREKLEYERLAGLYDAPISINPTNDFHNQTTLDNKYYSKLKNVLEGVDTYWLKQPIRNSIQADHNLTIQGGANDVRYLLSGNYGKTNGTLKGADRTTYGASFNLNYRIANKITFSNMATYSAATGRNSPYGDFSEYTRLNPYWRPYDENGDLVPRFDESINNPLFVASLRSLDKNSRHSIRNNTRLEWRPNQDWMFNIDASLTKTFNSSDRFTSPYHPDFIEETELRKKGRYIQGNGEGFEYTARASARYNRIVNSHVLGAQLTGELNSVNSLSRSHTITGFSTDLFIDPSLGLGYPEGSKPSVTENNKRLLGLVGVFDYSYDQRYAVILTGRFDGSSLFGEKERYQFFPSAGLRWNVHKEDFLEGMTESINRLALRATYGVSASQNFDPYQSISRYRYLGQYYYNTAASNLLAYGNENLQWQYSKQFNAGIETEFFGNRLAITVDAYNKLDDGMVITADGPPSLGFSTYSTNLGAVQNRGVELTVTGVLAQSEDFSVKLRVPMGRNKSKLLNISEDYLSNLNTGSFGTNLVPPTRYMEGQSINNLLAVRSLGIDPANGKEIFLTKDNQQTYIWNAQDQVVVSDGEVDWRGTPSLDIFYKNFTLFISTEYSLGGSVYNSTLLSKIENVNPRENADKRALYDRWQNPGDVSYFKGIKDLSTTYATTRFLQRENFFNLSNISLSYNDRRAWLKKYKIVNLSYSISTNNLFRISNIERERGTSYPFEKSFSGTLRVTF